MRPLAALALALAVTAPAAFAVHENLAEEIGEDDRSALAARGQRNNLDKPPTEGETVILDAFHAAVAPHPTPAGRATAGYAAPLVAPGPGNVFAWFGVWDDVDADAVIDAEGWEFIPLDDRVVAFVEPGSWPQVTQNRMAARAHEPDFALSRIGDWYEGGSGLGFVAPTGSLLATLETRVLSSPDLRFAGDDPLACVSVCLADLDRYAAVAPGPIAEIHRATVGPLVDALPPVSFAATAWAGSALEGTPASAVLAAVEAETSLPEEDERNPAHGASQAEIPLETYREETRHVFDAKIVAAVPAGVGVVSTRDREGGVFLAVEAALGLWRDLDGSGEPGPGEVAGACAETQGRPDELPVRLAPVAASGHEIAIAFTYAGPSASAGKPTGEVFGAGTVLADVLVCPVEDRHAGLYRSGRVWWFPAGVPELVLQVGSPGHPAGNLTHASDGVLRWELFWDRDHRPRWA